MFRKDEEAVEQWSEEHVKMCAARQEQILAQAAKDDKTRGDGSCILPVPSPRRKK